MSRYRCAAPISLVNEVLVGLEWRGLIGQQPRATECVRDVLTRADGSNVAINLLRGVKTDIVELPTCMTKRSIYKRLLLENGHTIKFGSSGRIVESITPIPGQNIALLHLPGFTTFRTFWTANYSHIIVPRAREDIINIEVLYLWLDRIHVPCFIAFTDSVNRYCISTSRNPTIRITGLIVGYSIIYQFSTVFLATIQS